MSLRFDSAQTLHLSADGFMGGLEAFEPLKALLLRWHPDIPVLGLETE